MLKEMYLQSTKPIDNFYRKHSKMCILLYEASSVVWYQEVRRTCLKALNRLIHIEIANNSGEELMGTESQRIVRNFRPDRLYNIFGRCITGRQYVPGREIIDEAQEKRRERAEFEIIADYIEQA